MDYEDAPEFDKGWTEAAMAVVTIWHTYKVKYDGDLTKVAQAMDAFFDGVVGRLEGESLNSIQNKYDEKMAYLDY